MSNIISSRGSSIPNYYSKQQAMNLGFAEQDPSLALSILEEHPCFYDENEERQLREQRRIAEDMDAYLMKEVREFEEMYSGWFDKRNQNAEENVDYFLSRQWTNGDKARIIESGRKPYTFNMIRPHMSAVLGEAVGQKVEWQALPAARRAMSHADFVNKMMRWAAQTTRYDMVRRSVFRDGLIDGVGVVGVKQDPHDPTGGLSLEGIPSRQFMWDLHSAKDGSLKDVRRLWRGYWKDRVSLAYEYPEWRAELLNESDPMHERTGLESMYQHVRPKVRGLTNQNTLDSRLTTDTSTLYNSLVFVREWYRRRYEPKWRVQDAYSEMSWDFELSDYASAEKQMKALIEFYGQDDIRKQIGDVQPVIFAPRRVNAVVIDQCIFAGNKLLRINKDMSGQLPYIFYIPEWYNGEITSYFEHYKDPQRFHNRVISFIDQMANGNKGVRILNRYGIPESITDAKLREQLSHPNSTLIINDHRPDFDVRRLLTNIDPPNHGQLVHALLNYTKIDMQEMMGGLNRVGVLQSAGQSGKSAEVLTQAASTLTANLFDSFKECDAQVGERVHYALQFMHHAVQMRAADEAGNVEFFSMMENGIQSIKDLQFDIKVHEVVPSPSEMLMQQRALMELASQLGPEVGAMIIPAIVERANIPAKMKTMITQGIAAQQQQRQANIEADLAKEERKIDMHFELEQRKIDIKEREVAVLEDNPTKVSMQYKMEADPLTEAALLQDSGIDAHPLMVAAGKSVQTIMDVDKQRLFQQSYYDNLPKEVLRREAEKSYKESPVTTPKDRKNRSTKGDK